MEDTVLWVDLQQKDGINYSIRQYKLQFHHLSYHSIQFALKERREERREKREERREKGEGRREKGEERRKKREERREKGEERREKREERREKRKLPKGP